MNIIHFNFQLLNLFSKRGDPSVFWIKMRNQNFKSIFILFGIKFSPCLFQFNLNWYKLLLMLLNLMDSLKKLQYYSRIILQKMNSLPGKNSQPFILVFIINNNFKFISQFVRDPIFIVLSFVYNMSVELLFRQ
jgi:hypothetical protein